MLTKTQMRELTIDTMASWGLEGMDPAPETLTDIRDLVDGRISREEFDRRTKAL